MRDYDTLLADASQPPLDARIRLIETLWDTLPDDAMPPLRDEWLAEIHRRFPNTTLALCSRFPGNKAGRCLAPG